MEANHLFYGIIQGVSLMAAQPTQNVNLDWMLKRHQRPEFWRNNGDGTCTRLSDGLTLTEDEYTNLLVQVDFRTRRGSREM
jgi:hypothetical protein